MIPKTRTDFLFKVSAKSFTKNHSFQDSGCLYFPGSSPDYWTHGFPAKVFCETFNVTSYYGEDTMVR